MKKYIINIVSFLLVSLATKGQDTKVIKKYKQLLSNSSIYDIDIELLTAKYWQLRSDFEMHFIDT
jgi:hypothetical protein